MARLGVLQASKGIEIEFSCSSSSINNIWRQTNILRLTKRKWLVMIHLDIMIFAGLAHIYIEFPRYRDDLQNRHGIEL